MKSQMKIAVGAYSVPLQCINYVFRCIEANRENDNICDRNGFVFFSMIGMFIEQYEWEHSLELSDQEKQVVHSFFSDCAQ